MLNAAFDLLRGIGGRVDFLTFFDIIFYDKTESSGGVYNAFPFFFIAKRAKRVRRFRLY